MRAPKGELLPYSMYMLVQQYIQIAKSDLIEQESRASVFDKTTISRSKLYQWLQIIVKETCKNSNVENWKLPH